MEEKISLLKYQLVGHPHASKSNSANRQCSVTQTHTIWDRNRDQHLNTETLNSWVSDCGSEDGVGFSTHWMIFHFFLDSSSQYAKFGLFCSFQQSNIFNLLSVLSKKFRLSGGWQLSLYNRFSLLGWTTSWLEMLKYSPPFFLLARVVTKCREHKTYIVYMSFLFMHWQPPWWHCVPFVPLSHSCQCKISGAY